MNSSLDIVSPAGAGVVAGIVLVVGLLAVAVLHKRRRKSDVTEIAAAPRDVVVLHQPVCGPYAPSISPFVVKLETYLRLAKIPYQNIHDGKRGPKGKVPWIEYNGVVVPDSEHCIQYLRETLVLDINETLSPEQRASARAFQRMVDEHTYWLMLMFRWIYDDKKEVLYLAKWRRIKMIIVRFMARYQTYYQGVGRHTPDEIVAILDGDFRAMSEYLADKKYFFGDVPTEVDCAIFGQMSQFVWHLPGTVVPVLLTEKYPNLVEYCERIKCNYWPDWSNCVTHGDRLDIVKWEDGTATT